jgi:hypothetical protein
MPYRNLLLKLDGKMPNVALMRLSAPLKQRGELVDFRRISSPRMLERGLFDEPWNGVYASPIFERTRPIAERLRTVYADAVGGTGWTRRLRLEDLGVHGKELDYSLYSEHRHSISLTQRRCLLRCPFCCVREKEGAVGEQSSISAIWRGERIPSTKGQGQTRWICAKLPERTAGAPVRLDAPGRRKPYNSRNAPLVGTIQGD